MLTHSWFSEVIHLIKQKIIHILLECVTNNIISLTQNMIEYNPQKIAIMRFQLMVQN